jgi:hypothetical protein
MHGTTIKKRTTKVYLFLCGEDLRFRASLRPQHFGWLVDWLAGEV